MKQIGTFTYSTFGENFEIELGAEKLKSFEIDTFLSEAVSNIYNQSLTNVSSTDLVSWGSSQWFSDPPLNYLYKNITLLKAFEAIAGNITCDEPNSCINKSECIHLSDIIIGDNLKLFFILMKESSTFNIENKQHNWTRFIPKPEFWAKHNMTIKKKKELEIFEKLQYCGYLKEIEDMGELFYQECAMYFPVMTAHGVCMSYNSVPHAQIYKDNLHSKAWSEIFDERSTNVGGLILVLEFKCQELK